jgi:hydrogenase-4 component B
MNVALSIGGAAPIAAAGLHDLAEALSRVALLALSLIGVAALLWLARGYLLARAPVATSTTWACAALPLTPRMQYTASSYAAPLLDSFHPLEGVQVDARAAGFHSHPIDLVLDGLVFPVWRRIGMLAHEARLLQAGRLRWYLLYVILTVLALLVYLDRTPGAR